MEFIGRTGVEDRCDETEISLRFAKVLNDENSDVAMAEAPTVFEITMELVLKLDETLFRLGLSCNSLVILIAGGFTSTSIDRV